MLEGRIDGKPGKSQRFDAPASFLRTTFLDSMLGLYWVIRSFKSCISLSFFHVFSLLLYLPASILLKLRQDQISEPSSSTVQNGRRTSNKFVVLDIGKLRRKATPSISRRRSRTNRVWTWTTTRCPWDSNDR